MLLFAVLAIGLPVNSAVAHEDKRPSPTRWQWNVFSTGNSDLPNNLVSALLPAGDGAPWVGTIGGLVRLANDQVEQVFTTAQGLPANEVSALLPAGDGALWVGTTGGLARLAIVYGPGGD